MATDTGVIYWLTKAGEILSKWAPGFGLMTAILTWATKAIDRLVFQGLVQISSKLDSIDTSSFSNAGSINGIGIIGVVNAMFPLQETISMLSAYFVAVGVVILIRWIKSFVPTIAN